jgi:FMN-dependent NADH-azoreductase
MNHSITYYKDRIMQILHIDSSLQGPNADSSRLATLLIEELSKGSKGEVGTNYRNLAAQPIPHLSADSFAGFSLAADPDTAGQQSDEQRAATKLSNELIDELNRSDILVLAVPMYNFSVPSVLKSWADYVARAGLSFRYTPNGPEGLIKTRKAYVIATRGGAYANSDNDHQAPWIKQFMNFIGIAEVEFIYAEAMASSEREQSIAIAQQQIDQIKAA